MIEKEFTDNENEEKELFQIRAKNSMVLIMMTKKRGRRKGDNNKRRGTRQDISTGLPLIHMFQMSLKCISSSFTLDN